MTGWNEDNFLERLMAQARQQGGAERDLCPDAETLCAVLEGEAPAPLREQVTEHLRHCSDCAELQRRFLNFDAATSPEPEAVWKETRKRLDNWLESFLRSEAANLGAAKSTAPSRKGIRWGTIWSPLISWKVAWGLGVVALLVLVVDGVLVMELRRGRPPEVQVAARATVPPRAPVSAVPPENQIEKGGPQKGINKPLKAPQEHGLPKVAEPPLVGAPLVGALGKQEHALPQVAEHLPLNPPTPYEQTAGAPGGQVAAPSPPSPEARNLPSQPAQAAPQPPPSPATEVAAASQGTSGARQVRRGGTFANALVGRSSRSPSSTPLNAAAAVPTQPASPAVANAAAAPATEHPPSLRLEPGAHLLLALSSVKPLPDGSLQFRGTLLLPVVHTGPVPLDRGAEAIGAGKLNQGEVSFAVTEFVVQGARYTLKDGTGAMKAQTAGAGGALQFAPNQVLEMWPASSSVYEKAPDTTPQP
jgi:hypothetical protein